MEVGNEMEIFITLTKYNTQQWRGDGNPLLVVNYVAYYFLLTTVSNIFMRNGT